jgi:hypothetical protein
MSKYVNDDYYFEIEFPNDWEKTSGFSRIPIFLSNTIMNANILEEFTNKKKEYLNIVIETMRPEIPPDLTEMMFQLTALQMNYTYIESGRINIEARDHTWSSYVISNKVWSKKYMIVLNGYGYALTTSCPIEQSSNKVGEEWDRIVASFKLTKPIDKEVLTLNESYQAIQLIASLRDEIWRELARRKREHGI